MDLQLYLGKAARRIGVVAEDWHYNPETNMARKALPENTDMEVTRWYGFRINNWFIGIQCYEDARKRAEQGHAFGPDPNMLDLIKDAE